MAGSRASVLPGRVGLLAHGPARAMLLQQWLAPPALGAVMVLLALGTWLDAVAAMQVAAITALAGMVGLLVMRASLIVAPSLLTTAALTLVVSAALLVLGVTAFAALGVPINALTVALLAIAIGGTAALAERYRGAAEADAASEDAVAAETALPGRAAVVVAAVLCLPVLLVVPPLYGALLAGVAGALVIARWTTDDDARHRDTESPAGMHLLAMLPLAVLLLLLATRLVPFLRTPVPLGYDTGLYRWVQGEFVAALPGFPEFAARSWADVQPPGLYVLTDLFHLAGASSDAQLWGLLILAQVVAAAGIWLLACDAGGRRAANWAIVLFALSSAQFTLYYQVHFKQMLVLALLPYALWLWRRGSWLAVPVGAAIAATHSMGFLLLGLVLASDVLLPRTGTESEERRGSWPAYLLATRGRSALSGLCILGIGLASYTFAPGAISQFISTDLSWSLAQFGIGEAAGGGNSRLDAGTYAATMVVLLPFAAVALVSRWRDPRLRLVLLWAAWAGAFVVFRLVFERRFIASLDPPLIVLASVALAPFVSRMERGWVFALMAVGVSGAMLAQTASDLGPAIGHEDLRDLETASAALPADSYLLAVSGRDTPWVRGYGGHDTIAPGFLEHDRWTLQEWERFWTPRAPRDRYTLLAVFERPIYVFMRSDAVLPSIAEDPAFERISRTLWRYHPPVEGAKSVAPPRAHDHGGR